jgi:putative integral membrane protein (TIGR02587 family)
MSNMHRIVTPGGSRTVDDETPNGRFLVGLARAFASATIFSLPLLMTMEMWWLGFAMPPLHLALLVTMLLPLLVGLSYVSGFEDTETLREDIRDAFVAFAVGITSSVLVLLMLDLLRSDMSLDEWVRRASLQAVPASIGALLAQSQLGDVREDRAEEGRRRGYWLEVFLMMVGALYLAFNVAPTEEIFHLAYRMPLWNAAVLVVVSVVVMHGFVYAVEFRGQELVPEGMTVTQAFLRLTVVGYAVALLVSAYVLWTFGRFTGGGLFVNIMTTVVLGFPAAIGAAAARLLL